MKKDDLFTENPKSDPAEPVGNADAEETRTAKKDSFLDDLFSLFEDDRAFSFGDCSGGSKEGDFITLADEAGEDTLFELIDLIEFESDKYVVLLPVVKSDETEEVTILKVEEGEMESYVEVLDHSVLHAVFDIFREKRRDDFGFVD